MGIEQFKEWVLQELRIDLKAYKEVQLDRRIKSLMAKYKVAGFKEYSEMIRSNEDVKNAFLDFITINVTEFFRNPEIFDEFKVILKKEIEEESGIYNIWSAACSIGCEPYTLAIIISSLKKEQRVRILATDIDSTILEKAKEGIFISNELKNVSSEFLGTYFNKHDKNYVIDDKIKNMVEFKKHDLILDRYPQMLNCILCRNVVIYFKSEVKDLLYKKMAESLKPGGILFVGATESIYNYREFGFEKLSTFIYKKK